MKKKKNIFINVVSNVIIAIVVISVGFACFNANSALAVLGEKQIIDRGNSNKKRVTLMINLYWGEEFLDKTLQILDKYKIKTTFFVGGCWVEKHVSDLKKIVERGHELGNHGYFHLSHDKINATENYNEIFLTHKLIESLTGVQMTLFAPPSGAYGKHTLEKATELGYKTIMWSKDTIDWRDKDSNLIFKRATKNPSNGELILMHLTRSTLDALENIIKYYQQNGFELTTVSQNIS
ncbi:MAG: polysaccharide deacetylase family protein [Clostridia bacterium]